MSLNRFIDLYERGERFVIFDVETVGAGGQTVVVEIGAVEAGRGLGKRSRTFEQILRFRPPSWAPHRFSLRVHKIPTREIENGAPRLQTIQAFLSFVEGATLVCHTGYDIRAMKTELGRHNELTSLIGAPIWGRHLDSCKLARQAWPQLKKHSLSHLSEHFGVHNPAAHRALADAVTTKKLLVQMLKDHYGRLRRGG